MARALGIARQVSEALAVAHAAQIVHRDIKPDNVMVRPDGYVKLLDFGLARVQPEMLGLQPTAHTTEAGVLLGTLAYMAPEQARGELITQEADVFALGVMLYELVTGRHPFLQVVAARDAACADVGVARAAVVRQPRSAARDRSADRRDAAEGSAAAARRQRGDVSAESGARLDGRGRAVGGHGHPRPARGRRAKSSAATRSSTRCSTSSSARSAVRVGWSSISAEAGMGKTTLVEAFLKQLEEQQEPVRIGRGRCSERLAGTEAYLPILEALDSLQKNEQLGSIARLIRARRAELVRADHAAVRRTTPRRRGSRRKRRPALRNG